LPWQFFLLIFVVFVLYVAADACWDVSTKISRFWRLVARPVLGRVWGAVAGRLPTIRRAAPKPDIQPDIQPDIRPSIFDRYLRSGSVEYTRADISPPPPNKPIEWSAALAFLWKAKWAILFVVLFFVVAGAMRDWTGGRARLERDLARGEAQTQTTINERDTDISALQQEVALLRQDLRNNAQRGRNEIVAATPANEQPIDAGLVAAWRGSLDRLCVPRSSDNTGADTCSP